jgi:hypothetical protein
MSDVREEPERNLSTVDMLLDMLLVIQMGSYLVSTRCDEVGGVFYGNLFSPPGVYFKVII